jgi:hypothetical protein
MRLTVRFLQERAIIYEDVLLTETISDIKERLFHDKWIQPLNMRIVHQGKIINDNTMMVDFYTEGHDGVEVYCLMNPYVTTISEDDD